MVLPGARCRLRCEVSAVAGIVPGRYAAIDIGTVTCRLLVADVDEAGALRELHRGYRITNLGEGVDATGELKPQAMQRVAQAVADFQSDVARLTDARHPLAGLTCVATSASRDARNAGEFRALLAQQGVELAVIPGQLEAALSFRGASCGFEGQHVLVVDVGGGSTEVVAGVAGCAPLQAHSFDVGCRRVTERFFAADPPSAEETAKAAEWMHQVMAPFFADLRESGFVPDRMIAVAGTATTVVSVREAMEVYDSARVHGTVVTAEVLDEVYRHLSALPLEQRSRVVGLDPGRAPVIVAGLVILQAVLRASGMSAFTVSESDILQGVILHAVAK